jgi:hypothetical protein
MNLLVKFTAIILISLGTLYANPTDLSSQRTVNSKTETAKQKIVQLYVDNEITKEEALRLLKEQRSTNSLNDSFSTKSLEHPSNETSSENTDISQKLRISRMKLEGVTKEILALENQLENNQRFVEPRSGNSAHRLPTAIDNQEYYNNSDSLHSTVGKQYQTYSTSEQEDFDFRTKISKDTERQEYYLPFKYFHRNGWRVRWRGVVDHGEDILKLKFQDDEDLTTSRQLEISSYIYKRLNYLDGSLGIYAQFDFQLWPGFGVQAHFGPSWSPRWLSYDSKFFDIGLTMNQTIGPAYYNHNEPYKGFSMYGETQMLFPMTFADLFQFIPYFKFIPLGPSEGQGLEPGFSFGFKELPMIFGDWQFEASFPNYTSDMTWGFTWLTDW